MSQTDSESTIHLYWSTGCTSCLCAKEFLERNEVEFESHNVATDKSILDDMEAQGMPRHVPIISRGEEWEEAKLIENVADVAGVEHEAEALPVDELYERLDRILERMREYVAMLPDEDVDRRIMEGTRTYGELVYHLYSIPESFLEHEEGIPYRSTKPHPEWANCSMAGLETYADHIMARLHDWRDSPGWDRDWSETANVFFGEPDVQTYLERTTWHAGQHTRQMEWVLAEQLDADFEPLDPEIWEGLPMPEKVWDSM